MTALSSIIPKLFRNIGSIPFSDTLRKDLIETTTTVAYGALLAGCLYSARKAPLVGAVIVIASNFVDHAGTSCGVGIITTYHSYLFASIVSQFIYAGKPIPMQFGLPLILCAAIAWYCFNKAGTTSPGLLRSE